MSLISLRKTRFQKSFDVAPFHSPRRIRKRTDFRVSSKKTSTCLPADLCYIWGSQCIFLKYTSRPTPTFQYMNDQKVVGWTDTPTDILPEGSASCVQSFDDSLILQFAWRIAFRCVLHRCGSQDIHCWKCLISLCLLEAFVFYPVRDSRQLHSIQTN